MENRGGHGAAGRRHKKRRIVRAELILILSLPVLCVGMFLLLNSRQAKPKQEIQKHSAAAPESKVVSSSGTAAPESKAASSTGTAAPATSAASLSAATAVTSERLNIRTGVGTQSDAVCSVPANTQLKLTGQANPDGTWVQVETAGGETGWCCRAFLDVDAVDAIAVQVPEGVAAPLSIRVSLADQQVTVLDANEKIVQTFTCSSGESGDETPTGTYTIGGRGKSFYNESLQEGAYYWTRFYGDYLFHSIPIDEHYQIKPKEAAKLGKTASHGCIRLALKDAKWIYEHIPDGTKVVIQ